MSAVDSADVRQIAFTACLVAACATSSREKRMSPAFTAWADSFKKTIEPVWTSAVIKAAAEHDPSGCLYSWKDRRTVLEFIVESDGYISQVHVASSSGVKYLETWRSTPFAP
jgi:hypothetical protein